MKWPCRLRSRPLGKQHYHVRKLKLAYGKIGPQASERSQSNLRPPDNCSDMGGPQRDQQENPSSNGSSNC